MILLLLSSILHNPKLSITPLCASFVIHTKLQQRCKSSCAKTTTPLHQQHDSTRDNIVTNNDNNNSNKNATQYLLPLPRRARLNNKLFIQSRTVPLFHPSTLSATTTTIIPSSITIWELEKPSELIQLWWSSTLLSGGLTRAHNMEDPFGVVMWPGSILASRELIKHRQEIKNKVVLVIGAGTGVDAQTAAFLGAKKVIALDVNKLTLKLLRFGAEEAGVGHLVEGRVFDLFSKELLPECNVVVASDLLYNQRLAAQLGERCLNLLTRNTLLAPALIVTDSQRFHGTGESFLQFLNLKRAGCEQELLTWEEHVLEGITGSGVVIEEDQTYDAKIRMISCGWNAN